MGAAHAFGDKPKPFQSMVEGAAAAKIFSLLRQDIFNFHFSAAKRLLDIDDKNFSLSEENYGIKKAVND